MNTLKNTLFFFILLIPTLLVGAYIYATSPHFAITPHAAHNHTEIRPSDAFVIDLKTPVQKEYYQKKITITPRTPMTATINDAHTRITITPKYAWRAHQKYTVSLPEGRGENILHHIAPAQFSFTTLPLPKVIDVVPHNEAADVQLDIEDPITVQFEKSIDGFYVDFILEPSVPTKYQNNPQKTQFDILPQEPLRDGTHYTLTIRTKADGARDSDYATIYNTSFTTRAAKPRTWAENLHERLMQAKKYTRPQIRDGKYIDVNLTTQVMTIFENGTLIDTFLISSGKAGMNTPTGTLHIHNKHPRPWSKKYSLYMPYWMAITPDGKYGIHELPEWPGGYKEGQNHLGIPVSHGCMRLGVGPAQKVYDWAEIGMPVITYY